mmetsp:Transcript_399/g.1170  ORF Transcript_399/g.1170 Transcript_399/m.1170 type:complete len:244 (-) Transcript_399:662-1393(-)
MVAVVPFRSWTAAFFNPLIRTTAPVVNPLFSSDSRSALAVKARRSSARNLFWRRARSSASLRSASTLAFSSASHLRRAVSARTPSSASTRRSSRALICLVLNMSLRLAAAARMSESSSRAPYCLAFPSTSNWYKRLLEPPILARKSGVHFSRRVMAPPSSMHVAILLLKDCRASRFCMAESLSSSSALVGLASSRTAASSDSADALSPEERPGCSVTRRVRRECVDRALARTECKCQYLFSRS